MVSLCHSEQEGAEEVGGGDVERTTPNFSQLDELDRSAQESQDACVALIKHIRTALIEVRPQYTLSNKM